ncbi:MAG: (Fe-S)-binding protein [Bacteroidales bacterium]|jgi:Fe-S oxidoreductase|nr:(Fe-S)-binding protein [Bacteroidales bacterium]MCB9027687.1 (Fe-S)-binding protein [Bacteroidales bacterium]HNT93056.1 (Fe-S)-binding protein [Bacteroidales bacterium]HOO66322.1 (Fe-S)-binding protein [Bacteroidales bacterium]HPE22385.1 (Fe-S)-binding protein [Bacteroidales bacterium]
MNSDLFVIPFNLGLYFILIYSVVRSVAWFRSLSRPDKLRLQRGFFGKPFMDSLREIFMESLLHRKIFRKNPVLGYMHMSLAFGWFLLIVFGTIEADFFGEKHLNPPSHAIFFRWFNPEHGAEGLARIYNVWMDFLLAFILSGLLLAVIKRFTPRMMGMKKTTRHTWTDRLALTSLWLIFPSRLLAESFTCGAHGSGSFLTGNLGSALASFLPAAEIAPWFWWLYSLSLGTFFFMLPVSRYFHIPVELFLIFMRNSGITTGDKHSSYTEVQTHACSSCGVCISVCQMSYAAGINDIQSAYFIKGLRNDRDISAITANCLMCGRCEEVCPVGIELGPMRLIERRQGERADRRLSLPERYSVMRKRSVTEKVPTQSYGYLVREEPEKAEVLFFAGCMTHLTPSVIAAMKKIMESAGVKYRFMDEKGGVCCGRPLMLAGRDREARELINHNSDIIWKSGAKILVTSCPICYKIFRESYYLEATVMHHSEFINLLIEEGSLRLGYLHRKVVYHDPCELGRGSGIYEEPRAVISYVAELLEASQERSMSLCCGGSLGNLTLASGKKAMIAADAARLLTMSSPDELITACPLCKKTFVQATKTKVSDIAELVAAALPAPSTRVARRRAARATVRANDAG